MLNYILQIQHQITTNLTFFFSNLNIPTIDLDSKERLEQNLTLEEINNSIMSLQSGKAPGPDGFPTDFYKKM